MCVATDGNDDPMICDVSRNTGLLPKDAQVMSATVATLTILCILP